LSAVLERCRLAGIRLRLEGSDLRYEGPKGAMTPALAAEIKANKTNLMAALAHPDLPGVSPEFASRLSVEDWEGIAAGNIPVKTVQAFEAAAIAKEAEALKELFEEHAGILEYDAGLRRAEAQLRSAKLTAILAKRYGWANLYEALKGYPVLQPLLIDEADEVNP
jgi:TubC N-terminal docking domain